MKSEERVKFGKTLTFAVLFAMQTFAIVSIGCISAESSFTNWVHTDWSGQTAWSDATRYWYQVNQDATSCPGDLLWSQGSHPGLTQAEKSRIRSRMAKLHIPFIANQGQTDETVKYYAKTLGGTVFIMKDGQVVYSLPKFEKEKEVKGWVIKESFVGASISNVKGEEEATTKVNYFKGKDAVKWRRNISAYNLVSLGEVYDGIELKLKAYGSNVEKLLYVKPNANSETIKARIQGAKGLKANEKGELEIITEPGTVRFSKPFAYQNIKGQKKTVEVAYVIYEENTYGFKVGNYDKKRPLIIDPLLASTFIGGSDYDWGSSIAIDGTGNVYVTGSAGSSDYPITPGAYDESFNGSIDVFVSRLDSSLSTLLASTFIGGSNKDSVSSIAIDGTGNIYVTGVTPSSDYPITPCAYDESYNGDRDVFVSKLDSNLTSLLSSTFIGGGNKDSVSSIAIDGTGNVYVTGSTNSSDYPTTPGAYDESFNGSDDVFVSRLDMDLSTLLASTFIGGSSWDYGYSIALDETGNVYVTGSTNSSDYPTTHGTYNESHNDDSDVFVSRLNMDLSTLLASTFIGGSSWDHGYSIAIDEMGNVYVTGFTNSFDYPTTPGAYDESYNGDRDVFVSKLDSNLTSLLTSTFIGGGDWDWGHFIAIDETGNVYVTGDTSSSEYPTTPGAYDESFNGGGDYGGGDVFVSKLDEGLNTLLASTFIGGGDQDWGYCIAIDGTGNVYVTGSTDSSDYPTTPGAYDESHNGDRDVFVSKLDGDLWLPVFDTDAGTYPSIMGTHNGTITPLHNITVSTLYTYACAGTGGHTESIELYDENNTLIANGSWNGYTGDYHNITIHNQTGEAPYVTLLKNHEYRYVIKTSSYPQIIHEPSKNVTGGTITCDQFIDANGKIYTDWIPAIRLYDLQN